MSAKTFRDQVDEFMEANPAVSRSKAKRLVEAELQRAAIRAQEFKGDARYAPLTPRAGR
jgi:hypothetical protein